MGASSERTLNAAKMPKVRVTGARTRLGTGMLVVQTRFVPAGAKTSWVYGRTAPWAIAWGHQPRDQRKMAPSAGLFERNRPGRPGRSFGSSVPQKTQPYAASAAT